MQVYKVSLHVSANQISTKSFTKGGGMIWGIEWGLHFFQKSDIWFGGRFDHFFVYFWTSKFVSFDLRLMLVFCIRLSLSIWQLSSTEFLISWLTFWFFPFLFCFVCLFFFFLSLFCFLLSLSFPILFLSRILGQPEPPRPPRLLRAWYQWWKMVDCRLILHVKSLSESFGTSRTKPVWRA